MAVAGSAHFIEGNAAEDSGAADAAADLVVDEAHAAFVRAHVGIRYVVGPFDNLAGKGVPQFFLVASMWVRQAAGLAAAMRQSGCRIFSGHRPPQANDFIQAYVFCHPYAADGRTTGDIVDDSDPLHPASWAKEVNRLDRTQFIGVVLK